jgi:hypothetical protein
VREKPEMNRIQERVKRKKMVRGKRAQMHEGEELSALAVKVRQV